MALTVALILLDVIRGHIRGSLVAWIALITFAYNVGFGNLFSGVHWEAGAQSRPRDRDLARVHGRCRRSPSPSGALVPRGVAGPHDRRLCQLAVERESIPCLLPYLLLQLVLVPMGIWLAAGPLVGYMRSRARLVPVASTAEGSTPSNRRVGLAGSEIRATATKSGHLSSFPVLAQRLDSGSRLTTGPQLTPI